MPVPAPLPSPAEQVVQRQPDAHDARDPALQATLLQRTVMDSVVVDHETVARSTPQGVSTQPMICIYEVRDGRIAQATFAVGPVAPAPVTPPTPPEDPR